MLQYECRHVIISTQLQGFFGLKPGLSDVLTGTQCRPDIFAKRGVAMYGAHFVEIQVAKQRLPCERGILSH